MGEPGKLEEEVDGACEEASCEAAGDGGAGVGDIEGKEPADRVAGCSFGAVAGHRRVRWAVRREWASCSCPSQLTVLLGGSGRFVFACSIQKMIITGCCSQF